MRSVQSGGASSKLLSIESGRGLAALLVVFYHIDKYYFAGGAYWPASDLTGAFAFGHAGVEFFFVLSGFIMHMIHRADVGRPDCAMNFAVKRFERIYPFFWAILLITVALSLLTGEGEAGVRNPALVLQSALLMGSDPLEAVVFVSWTLWHEILFYGLCLLMIWRPVIGVPAFAAWTLASAVIPLTGFNAPWPHYLTSYMNTLFAYGIACSALLARARIPAPRLVLAAGALLFVGTGLVNTYMGELHRELEITLYGVGSALALLGAVEAERSGLLTVPRIAALMGQASFSIYLTHMLGLAVIAKVSAMIGLPKLLPDVVAFPLLAAAAVVGALVAHVWIEKPLIAAAKGLRTRLKTVFA